MSAAASFKGAVNGLARARIIVTGRLCGSQPVVELRWLQQGRGGRDYVDLSLQQARQMLQLLQSAIESADDATRRDGPPTTPADRGSAGGGSNHVRRAP